MYAPEYFEQLTALYRRVDELSAKQYALHGSRLKCGKGCSACCVDGIEVLGIEAENIRNHYPEMLKSGKTNPPDGCAFLDEAGACRIYEHRPLICRLYGPPLSRFVLYKKEKTEVRDICPLNAEGTPIDELHSSRVMDAETPENEIVRLQLLADNGERHRMMLRKLFAAENGTV